MAGPRESEREEGDDRWDRRVSEREQAGCVAGPRGCGRKRAGRPCGWDEPEVKKEESARDEKFVFLFLKCE
jgi:hypothetical protein